MEAEQKVIVVDVNMKFWTMVVFLVKLAIASIPAAMILLGIGFVMTLLFGGMIAGFSARV